MTTTKMHFQMPKGAKKSKLKYNPHWGWYFNAAHIAVALSKVTKNKPACPLTVFLPITMSTQ